MIKESKGSVVRARCSVELKNRVIAFAERFGVDEADVIRFALDEYIETHKDAEQLTVTRAAVLRLPAAVEAAVDVAKSRKRAANPRP